MKPELFSIPRLGAINFHPSLLPAYRGPAPLFWTFKDGLEKTGLTIHKIAKGEDNGNILSRTAVDVALGPGLLVSGVVRSPGATAQPGVRVEALCWSCGSPTPLATSISDTSGAYRIYLPDPGDVIVDGGVGD